MNTPTATALGPIGPQALWYLTRATGIVALLLLTASVVLGILTAGRAASERWPRFVTAALHRNISLLVLVFLGLHIASTVVDGFAPIGWLDAVIPFRSPYRPLWLGLGAVAFDLLVALAVTSLLRRRLGQRTWRAIHWLAYACWPVAMLHGLGTGTDTRLTWALALYGTCLVAVLAALAWRLATLGEPARPGRRAAAGAAALLVPLLGIAWLVQGPLRPGWAKRAGTPSSLTGEVVAGTQGASGSAGSGTKVGEFNAKLMGTLAERAADDSGTAAIVINARVQGGATGALQIALYGVPQDGGGLALTSSTVRLQLAAPAVLYQGQVVGLDGTRVQASVTAPSGARLLLDAQLQLSGGGVRGTLQGVPG